MNHLTIRFPWPDPRLSPNRRSRHVYLTTIRQHARDVGYWLTKDARLTVPQDGDLELRILICPPTRRGYDDDNIYSSWKTYRDGMFLALGTNDRRIRRTVLEWSKIEKGGALYVDLKGLEPAQAEV